MRSNRSIVGIAVLFFGSGWITISQAQEGGSGYWGLGLASISYQDEIDKALENYGDDLIPPFTGELGAYGTIGKNIALGGMISGVFDWYYNNEAAEWTRVHSYLFSLSTLYFPQRVGRGIFLRGDAGLCRQAFSRNPELFAEPGSDTAYSSSSWGTGILIGGGIAFPIFPERRITLNLNYTLRKLEGETKGTWSIGLGGFLKDSWYH